LKRLPCGSTPSGQKKAEVGSVFLYVPTCIDTPAKTRAASRRIAQDCAAVEYHYLRVGAA
jgi:hypothetical protein